MTAAPLRPLMSLSPQKQQQKSRSSSLNPSSSSAIHRLIFPLASRTHNLHIPLSTSLRNPLSLSNRLRSIAHDAQCVEFMIDSLNTIPIDGMHTITGLSANGSPQSQQLPIIVNERCGSWYVPPERKEGNAYWKSTDGHAGNWAFNLRRLNLEVLGIIGNSTGGCVLVDSTRRGKYAPDALSKTVPIWCAVMNRLLFDDDAIAFPLHTHEAIISRSEHSQIESKVSEFVKQAKALNLDVEGLRNRVRRPLLPILLMRTHSFELSSQIQALLSSHLPIYSIVASEYCPDESSHPIEGYVQGAGDDSESWAYGLTPEIYWQYQHQLLAAEEDDLPSLIAQLLSNRKPEHATDFRLIRPCQNIFVATLASLTTFLSIDDAVVICCPSQEYTSLNVKNKNVLHLKCQAGKLGSRDLRTQLDYLVAFSKSIEKAQRVVICCPTGKDLSVGVCLAILCMWTDGQGFFEPIRVDTQISKGLVRQRLSWIMASIPDAKPSRATLTAVNSFLMKPAV